MNKISLINYSALRNSGIVFFGFIILITITLTLLGCSSGASDNKKPKQAAVPVVTTKAIQKTVPFKLQAVGSIEPYSSVAIKSRVDGQILSTHFKEGQHVTKGQLLFQLDPRPFEAQLKQAQANLSKNQAQFEQARSQDQRYQDLLQKNFVSKEFYTQIRTNLNTAEAAMKADEAQVENARLQLDYATIRSPIEGRTGKVMIQSGNLVKANDTNSLVLINQIQPIYVNFALPENYLANIREYMALGKIPTEITLPNTTTPLLNGEVTFVDNAVDPATGTITLKALLQNKEGILWPGQFVNVVLTLRQDKDVITVPSQAVQTGPNGQFVFVIKDAASEVRPVSIARSYENDSIIAKGLNVDEEVVINGQMRLSQGTKVNVKNEGKKSEGKK